MWQKVRKESLKRQSYPQNQKQIWHTVLELSNQECKITLIFRTEILRKYQKKILDIKTEIKSAFDEPITGLSMAKEGIHELEGRTIETSQTDMQKEKWKKSQ